MAGGKQHRLARAFGSSLLLAGAFFGSSRAGAQAPSSSLATAATLAEVPDGGAAQFRSFERSTAAEGPRPETKVTIDRAGMAANLAVDDGAQGAQISLGAGSDAARVTLAGAIAGAQVIASRTSDIVGRPIDIFRPIGIGSSTLTAFPSRMPVASRYVTSGFGYRTHPILGGVRLHSGVDLAAPYGSPIVATADGVVGEADWRGGYGLFVAVDSGGVQTRYGHMSRINVAPGQRVRQGDVIGYVGSTGRSTGPHLHYEVRVNGQAVDPLRTRGK